MLDLNKNYVSVGPFQIQGHEFYGLPEKFGIEKTETFAEHFERRMKYIADKLDLLYDKSYSGKQSGYGHGRETFRLTNRDGSLIFEMVHVNHCDGPGYFCSYSHGPWFEYGEYNGDAEPDQELIEALRVKKKLAEKFRF